MPSLKALIVAASFAIVGTAAAQTPAQPAPPKLIVTLAVDQFSADLFAAYRQYFTGGFARLLTGAVFPSGYQSHANTETCPGHSTILTGARPGRTGIIGNGWSDPRAKRDDKDIYCLEDETIAGTSSRKYVVSPVHLRVPTLGDRLKAAGTGARNVAVSGKDRSAVAMAGHNADEIWWWSRTQFVSYAGRAEPPAVTAANAALKQLLSAPRAPSDLPDVCRARDRDIPIAPKITVGRGRLARDVGDTLRHQASPEADASVLDLGLQLVKDMKLGQGPATDVLALGLSASDYVGHVFGPGGTEMCIQLLALDQLLAKFFTVMDATGIDYVVALTADHGGQDVPERNHLHGASDAQRVVGDLPAAKVGAEIGKQLKLKGPVLYGDPFGVGDVWIDPALSKRQRAEVLKRALAFYRGHRHVAAVFTREDLLAVQIPRSPPDEWTLIERARAGFDPERSGDFTFLLRPRVLSVEATSQPYTAGHGSPWDYDRRVPIVFWRKGMAGFEQPFAVETVDIMPTLAAMIGFPLKPGDVDGRCLFGC